ncbi:MAG TPA: hypothetical protein VIH27_05815 [Nitrososphaerales archaeon]
MSKCEKHMARVSDTAHSSNNGLTFMPRSREITLIAVFTALAIILHMSPLKFPAPYAPYLIYEIWEIPIVTALLLYGIRISASIAIFNFLSLLVFFPGTIPTGPIYNLIAIFSMLLGILLAIRVKGLIPQLRNVILTFGFTLALGIIARVLIMTLINFVFLAFPPPLGFNMPRDYIFIALPLIGFFNGSVALYTIILGRFLSTAVSKATRTPLKYML